MKEDSSQKAILLFDEAIKIDSNYFIAYWNRLSLQRQLKHYNKALETANQILKINRSPYYYLVIATLHYRLGDTTSANNYFRKTIALCDTVLDTMSAKNKGAYQVMIMNKGVSLVFLNQHEAGNKILKQNYDTQTDSLARMWTAAFMNKTKEELLKALDGEN